MRQILAFAFFVALSVAGLGAGKAMATCTVPNNLINGTTADATQVMGNFTSLASCASDASNVSSGTLGSNYGGAGAASGILKANGSGVVSAAASGTDYAPATSGSSLLSGNGSGGFTNVTIGSGLAYAGGTLSATGGGGGGGTTPLFTRTVADIAVGTVYQNTTGGYEFALATCNTNGTAGVVYVDSASTPTTVVEEGATSSLSATSTAYLFLIPNNYYWKITGPSSCNTSVIGQFGGVSWTDSGNLAGSTRTLATVYQNTGSTALFIEASVTGAANYFRCRQDTSSTPSQDVYYSYAGAGGVNMTWCIVPPGYYYELIADSGTLASWREYTMSLTASRNDMTNQRAISRSYGVGSWQNISGVGQYTSICGVSGNTGTIIYAAQPGTTIPVPAGASATAGGNHVCASAFQNPGDFFMAYRDSDATPGLDFWFEYPF